MLDECRSITRNDCSTGFDAVLDGPTLTHLTKQAATIRDDHGRLSHDFQRDAHNLAKTLCANLTHQAKQAVTAAVQASMPVQTVDGQSTTHPSSDTCDGLSTIPAEETAALGHMAMDNINGSQTHLQTVSETNEIVDKPQ